MLTWGQYSDGALGLGDLSRMTSGRVGAYSESMYPGHKNGSINLFRSPVREISIPFRHGRQVNSSTEVSEPTPVRFDHQDGKRDKFVFSIAASGVSVPIHSAIPSYLNCCILFRCCFPN